MPLFGDLLFLMICLLAAMIAAVCTYVCFRRWSIRRKWELVRKNSEYYQNVLKLNERTCVDATLASRNEFSYISRSRTLQDYEKMDKHATLKHLLQGSKRAEIESMLHAQENNLHCLQNYEMEYERLASVVTKEQCNELGIRYDDFLAIESVLVRGKKLRIPVDFCVICVIEFRLPGDAVYRKTYCFSARDIRSGINGLLREDETNPEKQRRQQERNRITPSVRYRVMARDGGRCCMCGRSVKDGVTLEVDHIIPISGGGTSDEDNLQTLCRECNRGKGAAV